MLDKTFIKKIDFFGILKKELQQCQNEWGMKCQRECTITSKCLAKFIDSYLQKWFKNNDKDDQFTTTKFQISEEQIKTRLMRALIQKIDQEDHQQMETQCKKLNIMNTEELAETYVNRISKLLHQQIDLQNRAESVQLDQYSNTTSQICPTLTKQRNSQKHQLVSFYTKNQGFSQGTSPFAQTQESQGVPNKRRRVPQHKMSEIMLLKQSEATTNDPETQHHSKQATPVSGRRIFNGGTIISKESFADDNKFEEISPLNNNQSKNGNKGAFSELKQRKLSFRNLVRNRTPVRRHAEVKLNPLDMMIQAAQIKKDIKQFTKKVHVKELHEEQESRHSSIPFALQQSTESKFEISNGEMTNMLNCVKKLPHQNSFIESDKNQNMSPQFVMSDNNNDEQEIEKIHEFELMIDSVFLEKNFSTPIRQIPLEKEGNLNNFRDYLGQEVESKKTRT